MEQSNIRKKNFLIFFLSLILGIKHNITLPNYPTTYMKLKTAHLASSHMWRDK